MEAIDVHSHYFPVQLLKELGREDPRLATELSEEGNEIAVKLGNVRYRGRVEKGFVNAEDIEAETHRAGLSLRILSFSPITLFYELDPQLALEACKKCNDFAMQLSGKFQESTACMSIVPLQAPELACGELQRGVDMGLKGVEIGSNVHGKNLDDPAFRVFFKKAASLRVPVFIHPIFPVAGAEKLGSYYLANMIGNPLDTTLAAASLIFGGVFEESPELKVILSHAGGFVPYQLGRFDHGYLNRPEPKKQISRLPSAYLRNIYFDTIAHNSKALRFLIDQVGADHVVLGSDYPFDMGTADPLQDVETLELAMEAKAAILTRNARELFQLE